MTETPANDTPIKAVLEVGQLTKEGVYIGRLKDKKGVEKDYFAAPTDAHYMSFDAAVKYAKKANHKNYLGHNDWVLPTGWKDKKGAPDVLHAMFNNKAKIGGFDETGSDPSGYYWSSSPDDYFVNGLKFERFSDGHQDGEDKSNCLSVRLVRSVPV